MPENAPAFEAFPKIHRLYRDIVVTEKIDGTNSQVWVSEDGKEIRAGSRNRWLSPTKTDDNFGFARWVEDNRDELLTLGPGRHFGEWWGSGIQRRYGLEEKRFSLFNTSRWGEERPACCHVVPVLYEGVFADTAVATALAALEMYGSRASPGFMKPEGVVVFHAPSNALFKRTLGGDGHKVKRA